ncbi:MAG: hypothetical protein IPN94_21290 [Sphingobacteriales bacterium]|nr:hypothetical protein [Sphingobacteriales bacterium]
MFDSMIGVFSQEKTNVNYTDNFNISPPTTTYIVTKEKKLYTALFLMPGMRFQSNERKAFQVSLAGAAVFTKTEDQSFPIPMCSWFYKF